MSCQSISDCSACRHAGADCIFAAHDQHLSQCDDLKAFCADPDTWGDHRRAGRLHRFLSRAVLDHMADEEEVLLPLLHRRGLVAANDADVAIVEAEHRRERAQLAKIAVQLKSLAQGLDADRPAVLVAGGAAFAHCYARHAAAEDGHLRRYMADLPQEDHDTLRRATRRRRAG